MSTPRLGPLDANLVAGTLYQGSAPNLAIPQHRPTGYTKSIAEVSKRIYCVVYAAEEFQPPNPNTRIKVLRALLDDNPRGVTIAERNAIVYTASKVRKMLDNGRLVLVTCYAGLNRSGVISALALMLPTNGRSLTPGCLPASAAIKLVRKARGPRALSNPAFESMLYSLEFLCPSANRQVWV